MHVHVPPISGPSLLSKCTVEVQAPVASFSGAKSVWWVLRLCQAYAVEMAVKDLPQGHCPMIPVCTRGGAWLTCSATARTVDSAGHACGGGRWTIGKEHATHPRLGWTAGSRAESTQHIPSTYYIRAGVWRQGRVGRCRCMAVMIHAPDSRLQLFWFS
jgi:hypothetical protein